MGRRKYDLTVTYKYLNGGLSGLFIAVLITKILQEGMQWHGMERDIWSNFALLFADVQKLRDRFQRDSAATSLDNGLTTS